MSCDSRLNRTFETAKRLPLTEQSHYVLFSDCHRGTGTSNDNFLKNQHLYLSALRYYYNAGFTYIELGDGDELWENKSLSLIAGIHDTAFCLLSCFEKQERLYLLYGNHDIVKKRRRYQEQIPFYGGLILEDCTRGQKVYLTHGHQADALNSTFWPIARFLVRYVWKPLEGFGVLDPTSAAKNNTRKTAVEERLNRWANSQRHILITGHTHRPRLGSKDSLYFNTGSCVHPYGITCIELTHRCFTLVQWTLDTRNDMSLYASRKVLGGPLCIDELERL